MIGHTEKGVTEMTATPTVRPYRPSTRVTGSAGGPRRKSSTRNRPDQSEPASRSQVYGERREAKRNATPLRITFVMFFVVLVSVFAFGLLKSIPAEQEAKHPGAGVEVFYEEAPAGVGAGVLLGIIK